MNKALQRSKENQKIYEQVIPRLLAGESPQELSKQFPIKPGTLRNWKVRAKKKQKKIEEQAALHQVKLPETITETQEIVTTQDLESQNEGVELNDVAVTALRSFLGDQAVTALSHIESIRPDVSLGLSGINKLILDSIKGLQSVLDEGVTPRFATFQGAVTYKDCPLTASDRTNIANAIKALRYEFAALHSLPLEPLKIKNLEVQTKQLAAAQHLHLHSHGSKAIVPVAVEVHSGEAPAVELPAPIDVTPSAVKTVATEDLEEWQLELIDS